MRRLGTAIACLAIFIVVPVSRATSLDPRIVIGDPATGTPTDSASFSFRSDVHGGGIFQFVNDSGQTWTTLDFFVTLPSSDTITCGSPFYGFCGFTTTSSGDGQSQFDIGFEQPTNAGILPGAAFSIDLNDQGDSANADKGGWGPFTQITAIANFDIPEPSALRLAAAGLLFCMLIAAYRRASA
ncbi:MAG TPA: hypothetical protein VMF91_16645 [Bryobacteraceae bacterium]|nr:hypothetical protein [Bryobacteraceae bacterium]